MATESPAKKRRVPSPAKVKEAAPTPAPAPEITVLEPIDTDKLHVQFDVPSLSITYQLKESKETLKQTYKHVHALLIIHGRIQNNPHSEYTMQCIARARMSAIKQIRL